MNRFIVAKTILTLFFIICFFNNARSQNKNFKINGGLSATTIFYSAQGIENRKNPFSYILSGNINISGYGVSLPFSFTLNNRKTRFNQPFNQFGMSPSYKWIKIHLGYRSLHFDPFILNGHKILGIGAELTPGILRLGFIYGRFKKESNKAHKINEIQTDSVQQFSRKGYAFKIGIGTKKSFLDFIFLNVSDDTLSLTNFNPKNTPLPSANTAAGFNSHIRLSDMFTLKFNGAYSIYTNNLHASPLNIEFAVPKTFLSPLNSSTERYYAVKSSLTFKPAKQFSLSANYKRIEPGYKSMGTYFMNSDAENYTFSTKIMMLKNKMNIKGSIGTEKNNLQTLRNATTNKLIGSANINYNPGRIFGINISYSNYSVNQKPGRIQIADSVKLYQTNSSLIVMPHFQFQGKNKKTNHFITVLYTKMGLKDKNPFTENYTNFNVENIMLSYNLTFINLGFNIFSSFNYNTVEMSAGKSTNKGLTAGVSKSFINRKLNMSVSTTIMQSRNLTENTLTLTPSYNADYRINKHNDFRIKLYLISNKNETDNTKSFNEKTVDFSYIFTF